MRLFSPLFSVPLTSLLQVGKKASTLTLVSSQILEPFTDDKCLVYPILWRTASFFWFKFTATSGLPSITYTSPCLSAWNVSESGNFCSQKKRGTNKDLWHSLQWLYLSAEALAKQQGYRSTETCWSSIPCTKSCIQKVTPNTVLKKAPGHIRTVLRKGYMR